MNVASMAGVGTLKGSKEKRAGLMAAALNSHHLVRRPLGDGRFAKAETLTIRPISEMRDHAETVGGKAVVRCLTCAAQKRSSDFPTLPKLHDTHDREELSSEAHVFAMAVDTKNAKGDGVESVALFEALRTYA